MGFVSGSLEQPPKQRKCKQKAEGGKHKRGKKKGRPEREPNEKKGKCCSWLGRSVKGRTRGGGRGGKTREQSVGWHDAFYGPEGAGVQRGEPRGRLKKKKVGDPKRGGLHQPPW